MIYLDEIFGLVAETTEHSIKLYRHTGQDVDYSELARSGFLEAFQSIQSQRCLGADYIGFFIGEEQGLARFAGMWSVNNPHPVRGCLDMSRVPAGFEVAQYWNDKCHFYDLTKIDSYQRFENRLVVRWPTGRAASRWFRRPSGEIAPFEIVQLRPQGFLRSFPGFDNLTLSHSELRELEKLGDGGAGWIEALRSTRGVYLITDLESGDLYVGSATGAGGLWARWKVYAATVHGGNKLMLEASEKQDHVFASRLQFTVLETMSNLATRDDGLHAERRWKHKLGRKATILNAN